MLKNQDGNYSYNIQILANHDALDFGGPRLRFMKKGSDEPAEVAAEEGGFSLTSMKRCSPENVELKKRKEEKSQGLCT